MFEKEAEEIANKRCHEIMCFGHCSFSSPKHHRCGEWHREYNCAKEGIEYGYNKANEWFDAKTSIPLPKKAEIYRYTLEAISDKGDIVCYDYKDKNWKKLVIEDEKVTYVPVEIKMWCNKPTKEE